MTKAHARSRIAPVFSPVVAAWLLVAGVFGFCAFLVLSAFAPDLKSGFDGGAHALSRSAVGFAGIVRLLKAEGEVATVSRRVPGQDEEPPGLTIITPDVTSDGAALAKRAANGRVLVVLPKWATMPDPRQLGWVEPVSLVDADSVRRLVKPTLGALTVGRRHDTAARRLMSPGSPADNVATAPVVSLQVIRTADNLKPVVTDDAGDVLLAGSADGRLFVLSDPDLMNTRGLRELAGARAATALIQTLKPRGEGVVFDVTLNGFNTPPNLLKLAVEPPFLGATLCLLAAALLMGLHAVSRFGAPAAEGRAIALGKQALADNSAALIRLAGREPHMAARYLELARASVVRELAITRVPAGEIDDFLDRLAERIGARHRLADLSRAVANARGRDDALAAALALHEWRLEMTREPQ
ncbi:DUF4350 domain-containing protein [Phenylobacterium montanum]|uniref:DUF4350 domain-containing protein n=1 Tax=Phenylobacterium montanum TaxID=2823693 RepID=A0A975ISZ2_9CAUL|nr:DUF4350 domain-containing protein [Caulobacter sp. S6]QUD86190.1 hypothetical protein KCG34_13885 [Caulobacter sp. S6]